LRFFDIQMTYIVREFARTPKTPKGARIPETIPRSRGPIKGGGREL